MDSSGSREPPGEADEVPGCKANGRGLPIPNQEAAELDWPASSSHLEQVEFVEETPHEYGRASFVNFEAGTPFSPQQSTSMDYEHRVSPLDPNMSSAARYSPVQYSMSNTLAAPSSPSHALASISNPSSPFPSSVGIPHPSSPISSTSNPVMPVSLIDSFTESQIRRQQSQSSLAHTSRVQNPGPSFSSASLRSPGSPMPGPSGLLRQAFFHADRLTPSPSPHSPLQAPMTPSDNFVSSSTGPPDDGAASLLSSAQELQFLSQASDSSSMLEAKVDSTREVPTPLHDSHEIDSSSPSGSFGHEASPIEEQEDEDGIDKSPDSPQVEVLMGYDSFRIVESDARYITNGTDSYLNNNTNVESLDSIVVSVKSRHGLVFSAEGLSRSDLLTLKTRGGIFLDSDGSGSNGILLDSSIASLKEHGLVLEEIPELQVNHVNMEDRAVLETLKSRNLDEEELHQLAQSQPVQEQIDTDGKLLDLHHSHNEQMLCEEQEIQQLAEQDLTQHLNNHDDLLLAHQPEPLQEEKSDNLESSNSSIELPCSPLHNVPMSPLRRSKRNQTRPSSCQSPIEKENGISHHNRSWIQAKKRCEECYELYTNECPQHRIQAITDKPVPARAWASLPAAYLAINRIIKTGGYGVFARKTIPKRTQFGPLEGVLIKMEEWPIVEEDQDSLDLTVEGENGIFVKLDTSSENSSNWMRFVRSARCHTDMNLVVSQQNGALYYTTTRVILPKQELQVGYSVPYATKRNLPILEPNPMEDTENTWPCFECNDRFSSSDALQKHLNEHDVEREQEEELSKAKTKRQSRPLKRKVLSHFPTNKFKSPVDTNKKVRDDGEFRCHLCLRSFPRSYSLKRHLMIHSGGDKKHPCGHCGMQFLHPFNRERHIKKHHREDSCEENKEFKEFQPKEGKESEYYSSDEGSWLCSHCPLTFETPSMLNLHTLAHAVEDIEEREEHILTPLSQMQQCPQCLQQYSSKKELIQHASVHGKALLRRLRGTINPAKPYKCELCYKSFASDDRLQRHMLVHGAEDSKPLQCVTCFKRFLNNSALACHVKIHTKEKKLFECPICRAEFEQVVALKDHVHIHALDGMYTCPHCRKIFCGYSLIRKHIRAFHSERKHTCSFCSSLFPTLDKLRMHMLRHSDHREFLCANCGKQFKRKDKLKEHMKRMHSAEREAKMAEKPSRECSTKKFIPKVSPTDYHRFIYKCHTCLLGFKRRGMLVNHLAKRHPDISPDSVPELNLPILKTTRDYYCQYCEKVYKSSSKRKAHILKNHPGLELPMSNRRKGGVPDIPGVPNPTFSQTVGSVTTRPHGCPWCHKQYASKAKLLQHQRKKHTDLMPRKQQNLTPLRNTCSDSSSEGDNQKYTSKFLVSEDGEHVLLQEGDNIVTSQVNIIPAEFQITTEEDLQELQDSGIIIDAASLKHPLKPCGEGDMLSQAMSEISQSFAEFRAVPTNGGPEHYLKILPSGHIMVTQTQPEEEACSPMTDGSHLAPIDSPQEDQQMQIENHSPEEQDAVTVTTAQIESSQLRQLLTNPYSLPPSPPSTTSQQSLAILPRGWAATFTSYTAR